MSSDAQQTAEQLFPVSVFSYRDVAPASLDEQLSEAKSVSTQVEVTPAGIPQQEVDRLVAQARVEATAEAQHHMQAELEGYKAAESTKRAQIVERFDAAQKDYFSRVEAEVVRLALSIAARILHREAQVDPMLMSGIVHVALEKLQNGSDVSVHIPPSEGAKWREFTADLKKNLNITIVEDSQMGANDCVVETSLGSADFSIEAQLKEVEQGFFDLLAVRPQP